MSLRNLKARIDTSLDVVDSYMDYIESVNLQGPSHIPALLYLIFGMFAAITWSLFIYDRINSIHISNGVWALMIITTFLFLFIALINPVLRLIVRLSRPIRCIAIVDSVTKSHVAYGPKGSYLCANMHIEGTNKTLRYETNSYTCKFSEGDRIPILIAHKTWIFE